MSSWGAGHLQEVGTAPPSALHLPPPPQGEWLLLFNSVLPFPDVLSQTADLACAAPGLHATARTETVRQRGPDRHCALDALFWAGHEIKETSQ